MGFQALYKQAESRVAKAYEVCITNKKLYNAFTRNYWKRYLNLKPQIEAIKRRGTKILKTCPTGGTTMAKGKAGATERRTKRIKALKLTRRLNKR